MIKQLIRKNKNNIQDPIVKEFSERGYLVLKNILPLDVVSDVKYTFDSKKWLKNKGMVFEEDGVTARSLFGLHQLCPDLIKSLIKDDLLILSKKILNDDFYIYQSHINYKKPSGGGEYWWHSDFAFWHFEDGMCEPEALSLVFFLDEATKSNGALEIIPESHRFTYTDRLSRKNDNANTNIRHNRSTYSEDDYKSEGLVMKQYINKMKNKPVRICGHSGDMMIMDANLWHYSPENKSATDRRFLFIILNAFSNQPVHYTRPGYLVERNPKTIKL